MKHALVVGGSGMLARTSIWLAHNGYKVSVIGRRIQKLNELAKMSENIIPISVDYSSAELFVSEIHKSMNTNGPCDLVVAWIHSDDMQIINMISNEIGKVSNDEWRLFHVLGSSSNVEDISRKIDDIENCEYHQVQLGFIIEENRSRWLTHDEISNSVIHCISTNPKQYLVGTLSPWNRRP
jgi:hypothetical protein